jgi:hypothetical protein
MAPACQALRVSVFFTTKAQEIDQRATEKTPGPRPLCFFVPPCLSGLNK